MASPAQPLPGTDLNSERPMPSEPRLRYSLRTLMVVTAGIGVAISLWQTLGPAWGTGFFATLAVIFAHVAGNALGCHLRESSPQRARQASELGLDQRPTSSLPTAPPVCAPVTRLSQRTPLGWFLPCVTGVGATAGAAVAGWWMLVHQRASVTPGTFLVGCLATAALAGLWTFASFSLLQVFLGAWWQAKRMD